MNRKSVFYTITLAWIAAASLARADRFEENNQAVTLTGAWTMQADAGASGGGYASSNTAGDSVTFKFNGTGITLYRVLDTNGGQATVTIDGNAWGTLYFGLAQRALNAPAVIDKLPAGDHTIVITNAAPGPNDGAGTTITVDAFETPITFTPTADMQTALTRLNLYRTATGIPAAQLSSAISMAAQAHSAYLGANNQTGHDENAGNTGYVGDDFVQRLHYFGYDLAASEDWHGFTTPIDAIDGWLNSVYHRTPLLAYRLTDIGYGNDPKGGSTLDFGNRTATDPPTRQITVYPPNNQTNVPLTFASGEAPDPLKGSATGYPAGFPISVQIDQPANVTQGTDTVVNSATLTDAGGTAVPFTFLDRNTDPNKRLGDSYFLIPAKPLATATTYTAQVTGTDTNGNQFTATTKFSTLPNSALVSILPFAGTATSIWIQWGTAGPVTMSSLQFGLSATTYGMPMNGAPNSKNNPLSMVLQLTGLTPATTYHYQITATDAAGSTSTSGDLTFTTPAQ